MNYRKIQEKSNVINEGLKNFVSDPLLCHLLSLRGVKNEIEAQKFLNPKLQKLASPKCFSDIEKAVERILKAISNDEKILVWGDFDCDGVTSSALMYKVLTFLGANFEVFIPNREEHGHGLNSKELIKRISKNKIKVLITVDCGISNVAEIKLAKGFGVDVIITDHHKAEDELPQAFAILNPQAQNSLDSGLSVAEIENLSRLAGVGVALKLAFALLENFSKEGVEDLKEQIMILAMVGTISDVVPLLGENRTIVSLGLELINQKKHIGIKKVFDLASRAGEVTSSDIAFVLAPRINATGRLSTPDEAFNLLVCENESSLDFIVEKLDNFNKIRQSLCDEVLSEALDIIKSDKQILNQPAIVLHKPDWHIGIIGIVASKLVETFLKPVFLMTGGEDKIRCSIRSIGEYNVYNILKQNSILFEGFGGHALAGGFSFNKTLHSFEEVKNSILATFEQYSDVEPPKNILEVDKILHPSQINFDLLKTIEALEPFGQDNPTPLFALNNALLVDLKLIGKEQNHLKFFVEKDGNKFECVKWGEGLPRAKAQSKIDVAFCPKLNVFNSNETIQLLVEDIYSPLLTKNDDEIKIYDHRKKTGILSQINQYLEQKENDIVVWAKKTQTLQDIKEYRHIFNCVYTDKSIHNGIMFFDLPSSLEEFSAILNEVKPKKIHIMNDKFDENIENYIKLISGMLKYCANRLEGTIDINKMAGAIGVSENFIQLVLEIFETLNYIEILDIDKIVYNHPCEVEQVKQCSMYEILCEEFDKIIKFKKHLANDDIDKVRKTVCL